MRVLDDIWENRPRVGFFESGLGFSLSLLLQVNIPPVVRGLFELLPPRCQELGLVIKLGLDAE